MSYHRNKQRDLRRQRALSMGDWSSAITAGVNVANDPYLPEVLCRTNQLQAIKANAPVPACAEAPAGMTGGIGLSRAVTPLRWYVYAEQHKWVYAVAAVGIIGLPILIGYNLGKGG